MKLLLKFNILLVLLIAVALAIVSSIAHSFLIANARDQVLQQAQLMMASASSTRKYTSDELKPLLLKTMDQDNIFLPQTVPAYGATTIFSHLRKSFPEYTYKEATINPTNLQDRASDWESDIIENFRNDSDKKELVGERLTATGPALYIAHPIAAGQACLQCHSTPAAAPQSMIDKYGYANGFGWKLNEVVAAQIVSVPMALPVSIATKAFHTLMIALSATFLAILIAVDLVLYFLILKPVRKLSAVADRVSLGQFEDAELPVRGKDEMAELTASFNRLFVTVTKALRMLDS